MEFELRQTRAYLEPGGSRVSHAYILKSPNGEPFEPNVEAWMGIEGAPEHSQQIGIGDKGLGVIDEVVLEPPHTYLMWLQRAGQPEAISPVARMPTNDLTLVPAPRERNEWGVLLIPDEASESLDTEGTPETMGRGPCYLIHFSVKATPVEPGVTLTDVQQAFATASIRFAQGMGLLERLMKQ